MRRQGPLLTLVAGAALVAACGGGTPTPEGTTNDWEAAYAQAEEAFDATEDPAERAAIAEDYLARFPETENTGEVAGALTYFRGDQLGDWESVWTSLTTAAEAITDPAVDFEVALKLHTAARELDREFDITPTVAALEAARPLTFSEHLELMEIGDVDGNWAMIEKHARAGLDLATPEAYRADYPERDLSDEDAASRASRRESTSRTWLGWSMARTDRVGEAMAEFQTADALTTPGYFGVPHGQLYRYWGATEVEHGDRDAGMDRLARAALWADDHEARKLLESLYPTDPASPGFEDWLWETRLRTARTVDSVTLEDYEGRAHALDDLRGEAMLLAFWFPT